MNDSRPRTLVVDDDPSVAALYKKTLTEKGYDVATAATGEEALAKLHTSQFDAAVIDLVLPGIGGMEVVAATRQMDPTPVVIILTGYASLESAIEAVRYGAFDYLRKPADPQQLVDTLQRGLASRDLLSKSQRMLAELDEINRRMRQTQATLQERVSELQGRLETLMKLGSRLSEVHSPQAIMRHLLTTAANLVQADAGVIFRKDPSLNELSPIAYIGETGRELREHSIPLGSGVLGQAAASGQRRVINDLLSDPQLADDLLVYEGMRRVLTQPLAVGTKTLGLVALFDERAQPFSTEDQDLVAMLAAQAATILVATGTVRLRAKSPAADEGEPEEFVDLRSLLSD